MLAMVKATTFYYLLQKSIPSQIMLLISTSLTMCHLSQMIRQHSGLRYKEKIIMKLHLPHLGKSNKYI